MHSIHNQYFTILQRLGQQEGSARGCHIPEVLKAHTLKRPAHCRKRRHGNEKRLQLHCLCFADDIVLTTPCISQAERMLSNFDQCPILAGRKDLTEYSSCVYLGCEVNMANSLVPELDRENEYLGYLPRASKKVKNIRLRPICSTTLYSTGRAASSKRHKRRER